MLRKTSWKIEHSITEKMCVSKTSRAYMKCILRRQRLPEEGTTQKEFVPISYKITVHQSGNLKFPKLSWIWRARFLAFRMS